MGLEPKKTALGVQTPFNSQIGGFGNELAKSIPFEQSLEELVRLKIRAPELLTKTNRRLLMFSDYAQNNYIGFFGSKWTITCFLVVRNTKKGTTISRVISTSGAHRLRIVVRSCVFLFLRGWTPRPARLDVTGRSVRGITSLY